MSGVPDIHEAVLLQEAVDALAIRGDGIYIDGTFGRGGHSRAILDRLGEHGRLIGLDKDPTAVAVARDRLAHDVRFSIRHASFADIAGIARHMGLERHVNGLLLDLGVSSPQLDDARRGFSFMQDGPLDMRMDQSAGGGAAAWLNAVDEQTLARIIREYGEERFARRIAQAIVRERGTSPITGTARLAAVIAAAVPKRDPHKHPATRTFQAIRIHINRELDELRECLRDSLDVLAHGARLVVISFHSLEDRLVKHFMRDQARGERLPKGVPVRHEQVTGRLRVVGKPVRAGEREVARNPRARSAIMRVAEVIA